VSIGLSRGFALEQPFQPVTLVVAVEAHGVAAHGLPVERDALLWAERGERLEVLGELVLNRSVIIQTPR
jgi:hypothetical protein